MFFILLVVKQYKYIDLFI